MPSIQTSVYSISRAQLAYWSAFEYVRRFWPAFIAFPVTGIAMLVMFQVRQLQGIGLLMILWPISIPARSILITSRAVKRAMAPTKMAVEGEHVYFVTDPLELNYRIHRDQIRDVKVRVEYIVLELWKYKLIFVPYSAFTNAAEIQDFRLAVGLTD